MVEFLIAQGRILVTPNSGICWSERQNSTRIEKTQSVMTKKDKVHKDPTTIGEYLKLNKYVAYFCVVYELMLLPEISNILFMVYGGARPDIVACGNISLTHLSSQTEKCDAMAQIQMDTECEPVLKPQFESVNYEFNYLCVNNSIIKDSISFQMIGLMAGNMLFGQLSDMYGRKKMLQVCTASMIILGFISSFANNLVTFSFARLFVMFFVGGHHSVNYVYMLENLPIRHRMWIMTVITFSPNYIILAIIAYYSHDWRTLSRILSAVAILPLIMSRYLHESPRWLLQRDKINRARHVFHDIETWSTHKAEKLTRREGQLEAVLDNTVKEIERHNKRKRYYPYHLFSTKTLAGITLAISYSLMTNSVVQYGLIFNIDSLSGSIFLNSIYFGACRYFLNIIVAICDYEIKWAGRRLMHAIATIVVITSLLVVLVFILLGIQNDYPLVKRIAIIISVSMGSQIYILNSMAASELFPTVIRNVGNGFIHTCNRIGGILAPQLFLLSAFWLPTPYVVLIAMTFLDVILYLLLVPESKGKALTDYLSHEEKKTLRETLGTQTCLSMGDFRICEIEDEISGSRGDENVTIELDYRKGRGGDEKPVNVHYYHGEAPEEAVYERKADVDGKLSTDERKDEQRLTIIEPRSSEAAKADETPLLQRETKSIGVTAKILQPSELLATLTTKDFGTMTLSINEDKMKETREVGTAITPSSSLEEVSGGDAENVVTPSGEDLSAGLKLVSTTVTTRTDEMATGVEDLIATMAPNMDDVEGKTKDIGTVMTPAGEDVLTRTKDVETAMTPQIEEIATKAKDIGTAMTPEEEVVLARTKDVETAMISQVEETVTKAKDVETAMTPGEEVVLARTKDVETAMIPQVEETVTKAKDVETAMTPQGEATKSKDIGTAMTPAQEDLPAGSKDAETAMTPSDEITAATKDVATAMTPRSDEEQMKPEDMESKHSADDEKRPLLS